METAALLGLLLLGAVVLVVIVVVQRAMKRNETSGNGADVIPYLVLALAMTVAGYGLAELASTAFPGDRFVFDPAESVATSLAALVVSVPFLIYFWRRQGSRRDRYPRSPGWTLYLTIIQFVFLTAFVIAAVLFINGLLGEANSAWTGVVVFGAIVAFHQVAARQTPPGSDAQDLPRVTGSAIGLITGAIGLAGSLTAVFDLVIGTMDLGFEPWLAMVIVGFPVWALNWLRDWDGEPGVPRLTWTVIVSIVSAATALAAFTTMGVLVTQYLLANTAPAGIHFDLAPAWLGVLIATTAIWAVHRRALGTERRDSLRAYEYALAAIGLVTAVATASALTLIALDTSLIVGGGTADVIAVAFPLLVALVIWRYFTSRSWRGETEVEATAWPRRFYHLGAGILFGLAAAASLITSLFILLRRILEDSDAGSLLEPATIFLYTGLAAWYLFAAYARDRDADENEKVVTPFDVTIVCSHPGSVAVRFPKQAKVRVIHRGDDRGQIDDSMADRIVADVANQSSIVWVDEDGFRVAPQLTT